MSSYRLTRHGSGFHLEDGEPPKLIAKIEPRIETHNGPPAGWRFKPVTFMAARPARFGRPSHTPWSAIA